MSDKERIDALEKKMDAILELMTKQIEREPPIEEESSYDENFVRPIKSSNKNYTRREPMDRSPQHRKNKFRDDGTLEPEDKKVIGTQSRAPRRPPTKKIEVVCSRCGKTELQSPALVYHGMKYKCNSCCCGG